MQNFNTAHPAYPTLPPDRINTLKVKKKGTMKDI